MKKSRITEKQMVAMPREADHPRHLAYSSSKPNSRLILAVCS
jgi:hypothetical protein